MAWCDPLNIRRPPKRRLAPEKHSPVLPKLCQRFFEELAGPRFGDLWLVLCRRHALGFAVCMGWLPKKQRFARRGAFWNILFGRSTCPKARRAQSSVTSEAFVASLLSSLLGLVGRTNLKHAQPNTLWAVWPRPWVNGFGVGILCEGRQAGALLDSRCRQPFDF